MFLAATGAMMAMATPLDKRVVVETEVVVEYATVTVTADGTVQTSVVPQQNAAFVKGDQKEEPAMVYVTTTEAAPTPEVVYVTQTYTYGESAVETPVVETPVVETPTTSEAAVVVQETVQAAASTTEAESTYAAAATSTQAAAATPSDMASTALYAHNLHRANHSAPSMSWLDEIAGYAENTANTCKFAHDMDQGSGNYGQNIAMWATSDDAEALGEAGAIGMASHDMWYNGEVGLYLPSYYGEATPDMSNFEAWGHFSQLVWKDSTSLGCYAKLCAKGTMYTDMAAWYMVCNYRPAGNVGGSYGDNVLTPLGEATVTN